METLEVHSKSFLVKWVHASDNSIIDWQAKPLKKLVNFAIYRKNDDKSNDQSDALSIGSNNSFIKPPPAPGSGNLMARSGSISSQHGGANGSNRARSASVITVNQFTQPASSLYKTLSRLSSTLSNNIEGLDLTLVKDYKKLVSNELVHGKFQVKEGGTYAFIFDNTFSKSFSKTVMFRAKSLSGSGLPTAKSNDGLPVPVGLSDLASSKNDDVLQGILLKRRRKKLQGFTKRFFVLNLKYGTLSYFNKNKLRGQMPISLSIVSANESNREIIIDSGMEAWDLKALNAKDFKNWINAFNLVKQHFHGEAVVENGTTSSIRGKGIAPDEVVVPRFVIQEIEKISLKLLLLKKETPLVKDVLKDVEVLLSHLQVEETEGEFLSPLDDDLSNISLSDFHDAQDYVGTTNMGVVFMETRNGSEEDVAPQPSSSLNVSAVSSSASSVSSGSSLVEKSQADITLEREHTNIPNDHDDDLYPLPHEPVSRVCNLPVCTHLPPSVLGFLRKNIGKDLSQVAMPVTMNEPIGTLQKYCELLEYSELIDNAFQANCDDSTGERILRIASFAVSSLLSLRSKERNIRKPFTPLLGETYELVREDKGMRVLCEKVSHKPVIYAFYAEAKEWSINFNAMPAQKFWGKTIEIITQGLTTLTMKQTGEVFTWQQPNTMLKNIIAGEKYGEPTGTLTVKSSSGYRATVTFAKAGMFSGRLEDLTIIAHSPNKKQLPYTVKGKWTESLTLTTNTTERQIWTVGNLISNSDKRFGFTEFAGCLNSITAIEEGFMSPTDTRLRPDIRVYEKGDVDQAEELKLKLEEDQRVRRRENEEAKKDHEVKFFDFVDDKLECGLWVYRRGPKSYWNRRTNQDWDDLLKLW